MFFSNIFLLVVYFSVFLAIIWWLTPRINEVWAIFSCYFPCLRFKSRFIRGYQHSEKGATTFTDTLARNFCWSVFIITIFCINVAVCLSYAQAYTNTIQGIARVVDGDTIVISGTRIRLAGIDAPESRQFCATGTKRYSCGFKATEELQALIANQLVTCYGSKKDKYGRVVATCGTAQVKNINSEMVKSGWAISYYENSYREEEREARAQKKGIWQSSFQKPQKWRQTHLHRKTSTHHFSVSCPRKSKILSRKRSMRKHSKSQK